MSHKSPRKSPRKAAKHAISRSKSLRAALLAGAVATALIGTMGAGALAGQGAPPQAASPAAASGAQAPEASEGHGHDAHDEVLRLGKTPEPVPVSKEAPGEHALSNGRTPGRQTADDSTPRRATADGSTARRAPRTSTTTAVPCTLDGVTGLAPEDFADFLGDPAVTADDCLRGLIWNWDARLAPVMSDAHVQAVSKRAASLSGGHDGKNDSNLLEMFTYLHAVVYHDFSRDEIDVTDGPTTDAMRGAIQAFGTAPRTFDATATNAQTLREALYTGSAPGLRHHQLKLIPKVLATMDQYHPRTNEDPAWGGAALAGLSVNYLGLYSGNNDTAFRSAVARDGGYRDSFRRFVNYTHLKDTANEWTVRDALLEYGRFGEVGSLKQQIVTDLGALLGEVVDKWSQGSQPWAKIASWLNYYNACKPYGVCKEDIEKVLFPHTYTYDSGAIKVRTGLDKATVDQLYYASKQVKAQFHRVLGTEEPLTGDPNSTLNTVLYASRADYENYHPLLTGMGTDNGGIYIERGATFYTYQRRVPQDSRLTLEELFRHEYVHYLNGRWAVHGFFGEGPWYQNDRTTAMDEGTAEFFDGATRDDGIAVRKSLVQGIVNDTAGGGPRMTVNQILHATYSGDGFRFYSYAGTFFEYLWTERPGALKEMYRHLRANDPAAFDAWRSHLGKDAAIQREYDAFLDRQIERLPELFVPDTQYTPNDGLRETTADAVRSAFASATSNDPACAANGDTGMPRFVCTGRITANLENAGNPDQVFKDMSETVDYFILDRAGAASPNLADMNCSFGEVEIWSNRVAGTAPYTCDGPLKK